jgi:glycosyltransferase involved in cell wall biosynthesis
VKILVYSDAPTAPTGFGTVIHGIFMPMIEGGVLSRNDVSFFGVNYAGDPHDLPVRIWPAQTANSRDPDLYGRQRFAQLALRGDFGPFDLLFVLQDHFTVSAPTPFPTKMLPFLPGVIDHLREQVMQGARPPFRVVQYIPVDSDLVRPEWVEWALGRVDQPVAYTEFGRDVLVETCPGFRDTMKVLPHGTTPDVFYPVPKDVRDSYRKERLGIPPEVPLVLCVNRNQPRKDIPRTLQVFKQIREQIPDAQLLLHMNPGDSAGFDLSAVQHNLRLPRDAVKFPANFSEGVGVPRDILNLIYNSADVFLTTARGEGWGLSVTEAISCGLPVVAPDHTSFREILRDGRGVLVPPEKYPVFQMADNEQPRWAADVDAMAEAVVALLKDRGSASAIGKKGLEYARAISWQDHVSPLWRKLFDEVCSAADGPSRDRYRLNKVAA